MPPNLEALFAALEIALGAAFAPAITAPAAPAAAWPAAPATPLTAFVTIIAPIICWARLLWPTETPNQRSTIVTPCIAPKNKPK